MAGWLCGVGGCVFFENSIVCDGFSCADCFDWHGVSLSIFDKMNFFASQFFF